MVLWKSAGVTVLQTRRHAGVTMQINSVMHGCDTETFYWDSLIASRRVMLY